MSGIVAASQSGGCCCRPLPCQCTNPNRPGAIVDASLTAINMEAELNIREESVSNGRAYVGCGPCPCHYADEVSELYGREPNGPFYAYVKSGCIVDPDGTDGTDCEDAACRPGGCPCCPKYSISAGFGNQTLERRSVWSWNTVSRSAFDHLVGAWNWQPRQVGYCNATDGWLPNARVRRFCNFPYSTGSKDPIIDRNGQFLNQYGEYTGANIGICAAYALATVTAPTTSRCAYEARIDIRYAFQVLRGYEIVEAGGTLVDTGGTYLYRKPCLSPYDSVLGTYECIGCSPTFIEGAPDQECGAIRHYRLIDITPPKFLTVS